jgi:hypothetical protein
MPTLRTDQLAQNLLGIVGWRTSADDTSGEALPESLTESRSGLVVQDLNELLSTELLRHIAPEGETLADFLTRTTLDTTRKLVTRLVSEQGIPSKVLLQSAPLLRGLGSLASTINPLGRFVGYRLNLRDYAGVKTTLPRIGIQLDKVLTAPLKLYVYSTAQDAPVAVLNVENNRAGYPVWVETEDLDISFAAGEETAYIGYYEQDLSAMGVRAVQRQFSHLPCGCANDPYSAWGSYAWPRAISVPAANLTMGRTLWAPGVELLESESFGLNLEITSLCDVATALSSAENQGRIAEALQLALGIRMLTGIVATSNITQFTAREDVQADAMALLYTYEAKLYGGKVQGTDMYYPSLLKTVALDFSGLDAVCQPAQRDRVSLGILNY